VRQGYNCAYIRGKTVKNCRPLQTEDATLPAMSSKMQDGPHKWLFLLDRERVYPSSVRKENKTKGEGVFLKLKVVTEGGIVLPVLGKNQSFTVTQERRPGGPQTVQ